MSGIPNVSMLRIGDTVILRGKVADVDTLSGKVKVAVGATYTWPSPDEICRIEQRPLAIGDRVHYAHAAFDNAYHEICHIEGETAMLRRERDGGYICAALKHLTRA